MDQRLKGQELSIKIIADSVVRNEIDSISNLNEQTMRRLLEAGYLGEVVNRFDEVLDGFGGDLEMHVTNSNWITLDTAINDRATRRLPNLTFNVVVTDLYANGDTLVKVYRDVHWGEQPITNASRGDYTKVKLQFKCSERPVTVNALP